MVGIIAFWFFTYRYWKRKAENVSGLSLTKGVGDITRYLTPLILLFVVYSNLKVLIPLYKSVTYESYLIAFESKLFHTSSLTLDLLRFRAGLWDHVMMFGYQSYFYMFPLVLGMLYFKDKLEFEKVVLVMAFSYAFGLSLFFLLPMLSPVYSLPQVSKAYEYGEPMRVMQSLMWQQYQAIQRDPRSYQTYVFQGIACFPSLHICHVTTFILFCYRNHRFLFWVLIPLALLLAVSTVYWGHHFVSDLVAGVLLSLLSYAIVNHDYPFAQSVANK